MSRKQCAKCPWKVTTDPREIPNGYCEDKHRALAGTIAVPGSLDSLEDDLRIMACHETEEEPCVGWLHHQLGVGNNIALRLHVASGRISPHYDLDGAQHRCLEDTLPRTTDGPND